ncbi:hypothetical protein BC827DRAFT_472209 [Russula dissimulans]|nr:hypothetical protein BC827DRAFT_472209 [Russula dissimulans]
MISRQNPARTTVRDLTAEEVAGTDATNQADAAAAARTERRTRRNRRTPSQISTRSLPAYMKEPGDLELVIIQGSEDMEDAPLTTQLVMPSVREDEDESSNSHSHSHSRNPSQASYVIVNDNAHVQTPLLHPDESNETTHELENPNPHVSPPSMDISDLRYNDSPSQTPNNLVTTDPRGEAPPYFEVVTDLPGARATSGELARVETTDTLPIAPDTLFADSAANPPVRRRSMFRGLIDAASRALSSPHSATPPQPHSRPSRDMAVSPSPRPSNLSNRPGRTRSPPMSHRTMPSNSGSVLSSTSSAFGRVASRTQSRSIANVTGGLTSPSTISITSISAPLTHTAVRTDFVYPRSGPTPEQLKLISSVESVSKFGVPYGPAAVAYASASLVNLHGPPPGFEELASTDGLPGPSGTANRPRATSALSRRSGDDNVPESRISMISLSSTESAVASAPAVEPEAAASRPELEIRFPSPEPEPSEDRKEPEVNSSVRAVSLRAPSPSPTVETISTAVTVTRAAVSGLGSVPESSHDAVSSVSRETVLRPVSAETSTMTPTTRDPVPPSSFHMPSALPDHTDYASRSSSVDSFCTAVSGHGQTQESDQGISDAEQETDAFRDTQSRAETEVETPPVTPHAVSVEGTILRAGPPSLSV